MEDITKIDESSSQAEVQGLNVKAFLTFAFVAILGTVIGFGLGTWRSSAPSKNSPEVGFARDMMMHHSQAVDMATLIRDRTEDPEMRQLALDIMLTQQAQIGQMQGWLTLWGYPIARTEPAMTWMGMPTSGPMPGMATPEQLNQLRSLKGIEAESLFLQLMIPHHRGGVAMGEAALARAQRPEVRTLAQSIVDAQTSETTLMQELLQQKGFPPVQTEDGMNHDTISP